MIAERERPSRRGECSRNALAVLLGLDLDANQRGALFFGLHDPSGLAIHEEQVVGFAEPAKRELANSDSTTSVDVRVGAGE